MNTPAFAVKMRPFLPEMAAALQGMTPEQYAAFDWGLLGNDAEGFPVDLGWYELMQPFDNRRYRSRTSHSEWDRLDFDRGTRFLISAWGYEHQGSPVLRVEVFFRNTTQAGDLGAVFPSNDPDVATLRRLKQLVAMLAVSRRVPKEGIRLENILDYDAQAMDVLRRLVSLGKVSLEDVLRAQLADNNDTLSTDVP